MQASPSIFLFITALAGAYIGFFTNFSSNFYFIVALIVGLSAILSPFKTWRAFAVLVFCVCIVSATAQIRLTDYLDKQSTVPKEECIFEGTVSDIAPTLEKGKRATFYINGYIFQDSRKALSLITTIFLKNSAAALSISEGDKIRVKAKARLLKHALSPGEFDAFWFGLSRQIQANIFIKDAFDIVLIQKKAKPFFFARLRQNLREKLLTNITPRQAATLLALMIGDTYLFDVEQKQLYRNLGAGHLLAVSGLQVSLLAYLFYQLFRLIFLFIPFIGRLSRASFFAAWFALVAIWLFTFLCGAPPSAVRAASMSSIVLACVILHRQVHMADAFGIAGLLTLLVWPAFAVDASFLLSYVAVFGLILTSDSSNQKNIIQNEENLFQNTRQKIQAIFLTSFAAGLLTLPISAQLFGEITPTGILVNVILVPVAVLLQTPAIFLGMMGACFDSQTLMSLGADCAGMLEALCELLGQYFGHLQLIPVPSQLATLFWLITAITIVVFFRSKHRFALSFVTVISLSIAIFIDYEWTKGIRISVLPVGQGDAAVFQFPSGHVMLVDGGGNFERTYDPGKTIILPFLQRNKIHQIDVIVLSHPDADHLLGLLSVLEKIPVRELWYRQLPYENKLLSELLQLAIKKNVVIKNSNEIHGIQHFGHAQIQVLSPQTHPNDKYYPLKTNDSSLTLVIRLQNDSALWPGDLEAEGEKRLLQAYPNLSVTIVKAPHHGSRTSSTAGFVKATSPRHVIFCTQEDNKWQFPHSQIVKRWHDQGAQTWNTGTQGEITIWLTGQKTLVKAFHKDKVDDKRT